MFEQAFKNIDDILWKEASCTSELDYMKEQNPKRTTAQKKIQQTIRNLI